MTLSESVAKAEAAASAAPLPAVLPFSSPCSSSSAAASPSSSSSSSPCSAPSASSGAPSSSSASAVPAISLVSPQGLAELLQEKAHQVLLLDLRSFMSFNQNQIKSSINVCLPTSLVKRKNFSLNLVESSLSGLEKERFKNRTGRDIILYDNDCKEARKNCLLTSLLDKFQQECHQASVALLDGGFQKFLAAFPQFCLCKAAPSPSPSASPAAAPSALRPHTTSSLPPSHPPFFASFSVPRALPFARPLTPPDSDREPVEIFDFLYVGSHDAATNLETLRKRNINYILNAAKECHDAFTALPGFNYLRLDLLDCASQSIDMHALEQAFQFIDRARSEGAKCLVHCKAGQSRSATIILSYIIRTFRWSLQDAYQFVQRKRPSVSPNLGFIAQLVHFEQATLGTSTSIQRLLCPEATPLTPPHLERASTSVPPPPSPLSELVTIGCK